MNIRDLMGETFQPLGPAKPKTPVAPSIVWITWHPASCHPQQRPWFHDKVLIKLDDGFESKHPQVWNDQVWQQKLCHGFKIIAYRWP